MINEERIILDLSQKQAVEYNQGPLLVVAGAGTGKTLVIVEKIKYLIKNKLAKPEEILALTFTEKAAFEMEERVDRSLAYGYFQMWISTFHAFADQLLKEEASQIGLNPGFRLMTEAESILFIKQHLFLFNLKYFRPLGNPNKFLSALLKHFSRLQDEDISPDQYIDWVKTQKSKLKSQNQEEKIEMEKSQELSQAYQTHQQLKIKEGVLDFSDLAFYLLKLFRIRPNLLGKYQRQFKYVMVDEFQDTNISQYQLIRLLCPNKANPALTVVGDDSQSIYKFRGASVSNIIYFMKDYQQAKQITLRNNYRSNQTILDSAYRLIRNNNPDTLESQLGISKNLVSQKPDDKKAVEFYLAERVEDEAEFVIKRIVKLKKNYQLSDFAILVRANNHTEPFIKELARNALPYQFLGPGMLFKQPEIKDLIAYLKLLYNLEDSVSLYRVLTMSIFDLDHQDIHLLLSFAKKTGLSLFQAIATLLSPDDFPLYKKYMPLIKSETQEKLIPITKMIRSHLKKIKTCTAGTILYLFLEESGYLSRLVEYKTEREERIALNISKFFDKLKTYEAEHENASVFAVVDYIEMSMELGESPVVTKTDLSSFDAVNLLTVHSSKGLEFKVVFIVNLSRGRFPPYEKKETIPIPQPLIKEMLPQGNHHEQEERRLFYVGLTRGIDKVFLSASQYYGEGKRQRQISPFVSETVGQTAIDKIMSLEKEKKQQLSIFDFKPFDEAYPEQSQATQGKPSSSINNQKLSVHQLSFSQIDTFRTCPLQYKYRYLLKIPVTPSAAESFGTTIHKTLELFYKQYLSDAGVDMKRLLLILEQNWVPIGFASNAHQQKMKNEARNMLSDYYRQFHSKKIKVVSLEKMFKINVDNDLYLTGKIDRVDLLPGNRIEVIDYKTGRKPAEKDLTKNLQLSIYALSATNPAVFNRKLADIDLSFYYLQTMEKVTLKRNEEDLKNVKNEIIRTVKEIDKKEFPPQIGRWCGFCPFRMICEAWQ